MSTAQQHLTAALVRLASEGRCPPCGSWRESNPWVSDEPQERAQAALWCRGCPVLLECGEAADEMGERFGVWGGIDRTLTGRARR